MRNEDFISSVCLWIWYRDWNSRCTNILICSCHPEVNTSMSMTILDISKVMVFRLTLDCVLGKKKKQKTSKGVILTYASYKTSFPEECSWKSLELYTKKHITQYF